MRSTILALLACALPLLTACGDKGGETDTDGTTATPTSNAMTDTVDGTTAAPTTTPMTGTDGSTTEAPTTTPPTSTEPTTGEPPETGGGDSKMEEFGHACAGDADCVPVLGEGAVCLKDILGVYELPGGYCSKICMLPDQNTAYVPDAPECGAGVYCLGAKGYFEGCALECTDNSQCPRMGYECRTMPQIGKATDPKFCLMTDEYML